jgi:hypothetical protein
MRRKRAVTKAPRRKSFNKWDFRRLVRSAREIDLPVARIETLPNGGLSLVVGDTGKSADETNTKNPWDEVLTDAENEKRAS